MHQQILNKPTLCTHAHCFYKYARVMYVSDQYISSINQHQFSGFEVEFSSSRNYYGWFGNVACTEIAMATETENPCHKKVSLVKLLFAMSLVAFYLVRQDNEQF